MDVVSGGIQTEAGTVVVPVPYQPMRGVVEPYADESGETWWQVRWFNATCGNLPQIRWCEDDIEAVLEVANAMREAGGIDYTISGCHQIDE